MEMIQNNQAMAVEANSAVEMKQVTGWAAIIGTILMVIGAILWGSSGTDLWLALNDGDVAGYLVAIAEVKWQLIANLTFWITGVHILTFAGVQLARIGGERQASAAIAATIYRIAGPIVVIAYVAMLVLIVRLAGETSLAAVTVADVVGWIGVRADDLATALILGAGPFVIALGSQNGWMSTALRRLGYMCGFLGAVSLVAVFMAINNLGFIILPFGMVWFVWSGATVLRNA